MTDAEKLLWLRLRAKQLKGRQFYRQRIIENYIVDFYCPKANLIIELDGGQHSTEEGIKKDKTRDKYMREQGYKILRFLTEKYLRILRVLLKRYMEICNPPSSPFRKGGINRVNLGKRGMKRENLQKGVHLYTGLAKYSI